MGELNKAFLDKVRQTVEYATGRPSYMSTDEEWAEAIEIVMGENGNASSENAMVPVCPHCGAMAPPAGHEIPWGWYRRHLERRRHRWWWNLKKRRNAGR